MHPDVYRELEYIVRVNQSHFIRVTGNVTVYGGDEYGRCKASTPRLANHATHVLSSL